MQTLIQRSISCQINVTLTFAANVISTLAQTLDQR